MTNVGVIKKDLKVDMLIKRAFVLKNKKENLKLINIYFYNLI
jgi:hypothetical protein